MNERSAYERNQLLVLLESQADVSLTSVTEVTVKERQLLMRSGEPVEYVYFPHDAVVSLMASAADAGAVEASMIGREGIVGGSALFDLSDALGDAMVQISGRAARIPADAFAELLREQPDFRRAVARHQADLMLQAQQSALCNAVHPVEARMCRWLMALRDRIGSNTLPITQATVAEMLGVQRTTVTLVIGKLQREGSLACRRGRLNLLRPEEIERLACSCYGALQRHEHKGELLLAGTPSRTFDPKVARNAGAALAGVGR